MEALRSGNAFGTYRTERDARRALEEMARARHWCLKLLGLETGEGSCLGYQVNLCKGACVGAEPRARHLARVKLGMMRLHLPHLAARRCGGGARRLGRTRRTARARRLAALRHGPRA
jgi:hypothetical protein